MKTEKHVTIIAEAGCNHKGEFHVAKELVDSASDYCGADVIKFQKRNTRRLLTEKEYNAPHPVPGNAYGSSYGKHREHLEFSLAQHQELKSYCEASGITYSTSVWDIDSATEIVSLNPEFIKIGSATNTNTEVLSYLLESYGGQIHVSLGMTTRQEEDEIVSRFHKAGRSGDLVLYACTSGYPVSFDESFLLEVERLCGSYGTEICGIGYSGHHLGIAIDMGAIALGASYIERHFTLDRTWKGTDHAASLEPDGLRKLVRDSSAIVKALRYKPVEMIDTEKQTRSKLKWING